MLRDGPVQNDYEKFREFDVEKQANRHITKAIVLSLIGVLTPLIVVYQTQPQMPVLAFFLLELLLCMTIMGPIIFYYMGRNDTKMNMSQSGYNIDWKPERERWFGYDTYSILRADPGHLGGAIIGFNNNPFVVSKRQLQKIHKKQREEATCEICQHDMFEKRAFDRDGGYFVEKRKRLWVFGVPIKEKIVGWDAYCSEHKPKPNKYKEQS